MSGYDLFASVFYLILHHLIMKDTSLINLCRKQCTGHQFRFILRSVLTFQVGLVTIDGKYFIITGQHQTITSFLMIFFS